MGVDTAFIAAIALSTEAAIGGSKCLIFSRIKQHIFCIIVGIGIHHIAICILFATNGIEGMDISLSAASRIPEIYHLEITVRAIGNCNHRQLVALTGHNTVAGLDFFFLRRCTEEHIVAAVIRIVDHFRSPNVLPCGTAHLRQLICACIFHVVQCVANRLPLHQILGTIAEQRALGHILIVVAVILCVIQHKGVSAIGLFVIAVEKIFVIVGFLLTFCQLALIIGHFILGLLLLAASSQKAAQHSDQQKQG